MKAPTPGRSITRDVEVGVVQFLVLQAGYEIPAQTLLLFGIE